MTDSLKLYFIATAVMSVFTFALFGIDKYIAKLNGKTLLLSIRRIPEKILLTFSLLGGSVGAILGMSVFRHKTRKTKFRFLVPLTLILWIAIGAMASGTIDFSMQI